MPEKGQYLNNVAGGEAGSQQVSVDADHTPPLIIMGPNLQVLTYAGPGPAPLLDREILSRLLCCISAVDFLAWWVIWWKLYGT